MNVYTVIGSISGTRFGAFPTKAAAQWAIDDLSAEFGASCQRFDIVRTEEIS